MWGIVKLACVSPSTEVRYWCLLFCEHTTIVLAMILMHVLTIYCAYRERE